VYGRLIDHPYVTWCIIVCYRIVMRLLYTEQRWYLHVYYFIYGALSFSFSCYQHDESGCHGKVVQSVERHYQSIASGPTTLAVPAGGFTALSLARATDKWSRIGLGRRLETDNVVYGIRRGWIYGPFWFTRHRPVLATRCKIYVPLCVLLALVLHLFIAVHRLSTYHIAVAVKETRLWLTFGVKGSVAVLL